MLCQERAIWECRTHLNAFPFRRSFDRFHDVTMQLHGLLLLFTHFLSAAFAHGKNKWKDYVKNHGDRKPKRQILSICNRVFTLFFQKILLCLLCANCDYHSYSRSDQRVKFLADELTYSTWTKLFPEWPISSVIIRILYKHNKMNENAQNYLGHT